MKAAIVSALAAVAIGLAAPAPAHIVVSINDGKQLRPGEGPEARTPDSVAVIDLAASGPRIVGLLHAPVSMIGPPTSVAVAPDESFALVTAAQGLWPTSPPSLVQNDTLTVIDLARPAAPRIVQTLAAGDGATGVSINRAGTLALVAATGDDTVTVFSIRRKRLTKVGVVRLDYESRPTDVAISPDGRSALVVTQTPSRLVRLAIDGTRVTRTGVQIEAGERPYGVIYDTTGQKAFVSALQGRPLAPDGKPAAGPRSSAVTVVDLNSNTVIGGVDVGTVSEHLLLSPDGRYLAVVLINGSTAAPTAPNYNAFGLLKVYRVEGATLTLVAETRTGGWSQGATWSDDGRSILQQAAMNREIEVYRFDGSSLVRAPATSLKFESRPGAIAGAWSR